MISVRPTRPTRAVRRRKPKEASARWTVERVLQLLALPFPELLFRAQEVHRGGVMTIRPSVFHGPTGTKSLSSAGAGQAGRRWLPRAGPMPQASSR